MTEELRVLPVEGLPEIGRGDDLARLVAALVALEDEDIVVITSKVVSKAAGLVRPGDRADALAGETDRVVATRGATTIVRTRQGLVLAAGGIDASNTDPGTLVLLPRAPDQDARDLRTRLRDVTGRNVAVVISDTAGRAWRMGQTDIAIGVAGLLPSDAYAGRLDPHGNSLVVTAPAIADEVAAAADLVKGKLRRRPVAVVRGLTQHVLPADRHGPGAAALVRPEAED
ncbi:MAG: coenzyme F420-0:L-glutamate ligase, partial [Nocardioidaceae bacterium]